MSDSNRNTPPIFTSAIPPYLLEGATAQERYIMENISTLNQKTDWQSAQIIQQRDMSVRIETQVIKTNGRVTQSEGDIRELQAKTNRFSNFFKSKYTWIAAGILFVFVLPWVAKTVTLSQVVKFFVSP